MTTQLVVLALLIVLAIVIIIASIRYRIAEVREDEAAWDALIERVRRGP